MTFIVNVMFQHRFQTSQWISTENKNAFSTFDYEMTLYRFEYKVPVISKMLLPKSLFENIAFI